MSKTWKESFIALVADYAEVHERTGEDFFYQMAKFDSILHSVLQVYAVLVGEGFTRLEDLPEGRKMELFEEAKKYSSNKSKVHIVKVCRALHCFYAIVNQ